MDALEMAPNNGEKWGSEQERETKNRIVLSVAAYSYEEHDHSFLTDAEYDTLSNKIDLSVETQKKYMDIFFKNNFSPDTGMWIRNHPERPKLRYLYEKYYKDKCHH